MSNDMCATTQYALMSGLNNGAFELEVLGPDVPLEEYAWNHKKLDYRNVKGFNTSSLAKSMLRYLKNSSKMDILIIEWPLIPHLGKFAEKNKIPWVCLDRSPPADAGIFGTLQWIFWKRAWKQVSRSIQRGGFCLGGTVVSEAHREYVRSRFKISENEICVLHAGFNQKDFQTREKINEAKEELHLVYHGRLDRHRGIMMLPLLLDKLSEENIPARLHLYGEGDCDKTLTSLSSSGRNLTLHGKKDHRQICKELGKYHIGLLPMPNQFVWTLASPIKRSEYLAANLCIIGVNHSGHQLENLGEAPWFRLIPQQGFVQFAFDEIKSMLSENIFRTVGTEPRAYADKYFKWNIITSEFHDWLLNKPE
jgi:glycosyltransferase involved in cell wall biosynthesis